MVCINRHVFMYYNAYMYTHTSILHNTYVQLGNECGSFIHAIHVHVCIPSFLCTVYMCKMYRCLYIHTCKSLEVALSMTHALYSNI